MKFLERFFHPKAVKEVVYKIVEVERPKPPFKADAEVAEAIATLQAHPGFLHLLDQLRWQRSLLISKLVNERQDTVVDAEFLKSGIAWTKWLEGQLAAATKLKSRREAETPEPEVVDAFRALQSQIDIIGQQ